MIEYRGDSFCFMKEYSGAFHTPVSVKRLNLVSKVLKNNVFFPRMCCSRLPCAFMSTCSQISS